MSWKDADMPVVTPKDNFHLMAKPSGPICNLDCVYCFYLEKENYYPENNRFQMSDEVLESYVRQYIEAQKGEEIHFAWQGGEPTLRGIDYFKKAVELQKQYANGKKIHNAFQTNGTLLDDEWAELFAREEFLIGISIDGPPRLHDNHRVDKRKQATFDKVMQGLEKLQKHGVEYNTLTVVNSVNGDHPVKIYRFLKEIGSRYMQFIPLIERKATGKAAEQGLDFAPPAEVMEDGAVKDLVMPWSVKPLQFGKFLTGVFDDWIKKDVGTIFVNYFDNALASWVGIEPAMCVFRTTCGDAMIIEHDGGVYSCDHFMYPEYKLGNLLDEPLKDLAGSEQQNKFGQDKHDKLPSYCLNCDVMFACNGECPKHRFINTPTGEPGLNYLCQGLKHFFTHVDPHMKVMAQLLTQQKSPALIMDMVKQQGAPSKRARGKR